MNSARGLLRGLGFPRHVMAKNSSRGEVQVRKAHALAGHSEVGQLGRSIGRGSADRYRLTGVASSSENFTTPGMVDWDCASTTQIEQQWWSWSAASDDLALAWSGACSGASADAWSPNWASSWT